MTTIAVVVGDKAVVRGLLKLSSAVRLRVKLAILKSGYRIQKDMQRRIYKGPKSGRKYKRGTVVHQASAPGQAPASDLGDLARNISVVQSSSETASEVTVSVNSSYAAGLEFGTTTVEPRPFAEPARAGDVSILEREVQTILRSEIP